MDNLETFDGDDKLLPGCGHDIVQFVKIDHRMGYSLSVASLFQAEVLLFITGNHYRYHMVAFGTFATVFV